MRSNWVVPPELTTSDEFTSSPLNANRRTSTRLAGQLAASKQETQATKRVLESPFSLTLKDTASSLLFGGSIYLLSSSRNSPALTFLGNLFYGPDEPWIKDRRDGLFGSPPPLILFTFCSLTAVAGLALDRFVLLTSQGDANVTLQLAGVLLINAAFLELSRVDSGSKSVTRSTSELQTLRSSEFTEFAKARINLLAPTGSCHKADVVRAFRRYYGKYRSAGEGGGITDREIEGLFVEWNKVEGTGKLPTKAGFVKGLAVKEDVLM
ncbi:hypothetical protein TrCOL_g6369 [Triparma columacea]|uniref:Uncharacterized protein n=1 Tax=Triparma columacea TaxID=722753 RepID=A0A9W7G6J2_9STRA|nr:hypothetical protein TrCOL_g6369 [Triparma columacea]